MLTKPYKHRAHEHKNPNNLPSVIPVLFTHSRATTATVLGRFVKPLTSTTPIHVPHTIWGFPS